MSYRISLNIEAIEHLRSVVNSNIPVLMSKEKEVKNHKKIIIVPAWDLICAIMDRIKDTAEYLNQIVITPQPEGRSAFSFYDYMNNCSVIVDCINDLIDIFLPKEEVPDKNCDFFHQHGNDNNGSDDEYFKYLRSLCVVHPNETSRHIRYQASNVECCPFVIWNSPRHGVEGDLCAIVYSTKKGEAFRAFGIKLSEIIDFVSYKYNYLNVVTDAIKNYQAQEIKKFRETRLRSADGFSSINEYAAYLKDEEERRFGRGNIYVIDYFIKVLNMRLSNKSNQSAFDRYSKAIEYAISFYAAQLQEMEAMSFLTRGIQFTDSLFPDTLLNELYNLTYYSEEIGKHQYALEKISQLNYDSKNKELAYYMLDSIRPFLEQYISFDDANDDFEYYVLVQIALYHDCLKYPCVVNRNIPNTLDYRERVIPEEEWSDLVNVCPPAEPTGLFEDLLCLINNN